MGLMPQSEVRVHIDRLVIHGLEVRDRAGLGAAVAAELERLLAERDWSRAETAAVDRVEAGAIRPPVAAREAALGAQIAAAVIGGLPQ